MSAGFALFLIYLSVPLAILLIALFGRPLPARLALRLPPEAAFRRGLIALAMAGTVLQLVALAYFAGLGPFAP
jgi:hypothetical protein